MGTNKFLLETNFDEVLQPADGMRYWESQEQAESAAISYSRSAKVWVHVYKMAGAFRNWKKVYYKGEMIKCSK